MHTFHCKNCTTITHNGNYSGEVTIKSKNAAINIECSDLLEFAAEYIRNERIKELENMKTEDLLK